MRFQAHLVQVDRLDVLLHKSTIVKGLPTWGVPTKIVGAEFSLMIFIGPYSLNVCVDHHVVLMFEGCLLLASHPK